MTKTNEDRHPDNDDHFLAGVADRLAALPAVRAVAPRRLAGPGHARPRQRLGRGGVLPGPFRPGRPAGHRLARGGLRDRGWGGGPFNGGGWFTVDGRGVDGHYRGLDVVEHELAEAREGRFRWEPLMFHLAGVPSCLVVAELAVNQVLRGTLPRPAYPRVLRAAAPRRRRCCSHD